MTSPATGVLLPLALMLREFAAPGQRGAGGGGLGGRGAGAQPPRLHARRRCGGPRMERVPAVAARGDRGRGPVGGAALRGVGDQVVGLHVALPAAGSGHQPGLPDVHLHYISDQDSRGAGLQPDLGPEGPERHLHPHTAPLQRRGPRLLFLLGLGQLDGVLQPLRARLPARSGSRGRGTSRCGGWGPPLNPFSRGRPAFEPLSAPGSYLDTVPVSQTWKLRRRRGWVESKDGLLGPADPGSSSSAGEVVGTVLTFSEPPFARR